MSMRAACKNGRGHRGLHTHDRQSSSLNNRALRIVNVLFLAHFFLFLISLLSWPRLVDGAGIGTQHDYKKRTRGEQEQEYKKMILPEDPKYKNVEDWR